MYNISSYVGPMISLLVSGMFIIVAFIPAVMHFGDVCLSSLQIYLCFHYIKPCIGLTCLATTRISKTAFNIEAKQSNSLCEKEDKKTAQPCSVMWFWQMVSLFTVS